MTAQDTPGPDVEALVAEALRAHPSPRAARRRSAAAKEVPSRVGSLPDPMLSFALSNMRFDDPGLDTSPMTGLVFGLSQGIPFPGKLGHRSDVARGMAVVAERRVGLSESMLALRVRRLYWQLHFAEQAERITRENERVLDALANAVHARFAVGQGAQQDALQAQVAHSRLRARLQERAQGVVSLRRALSAAVGREPDASLAPTRAPPTNQDGLDREALSARARTHSPVVLVSRAMQEAAQLAVSEAEYDRWPDLKLGLGYRLRAAAPGDMSNGADMFFASLGITLPVWAGSKQNARVRQRYQELDAASEQIHDAELEVLTQVHQTIDEIERLDAELALYDRELLPEADQALDASITDYQNAKVGFVSVLRNWRTELDLQLMAVRLRTQRAQRLAMLDALVGTDLPRGKR